MTARSGFTLAELLVAMVVALLVGGVVHGLLLGSHRLARGQAERAALQDNVRAVALVLGAELSPLGSDEITPAAGAALGQAPGVRSDLLTIAPGAVTYLASRGGGTVCAAAMGSPAQLLIAQSSWQAPRAARATDSLLVFVEGSPTTGADDAWVHLGVASTGSASCPGGSAALAFGVSGPAPLNMAAVIAGIVPGAPARLAEVMQMRYYQSGGASWFGMRSVSTGEAISPVAGPLADSSAGVRGLTLVYRDAGGMVTADPSAVRLVEITAVGVTAEPVYARGLARPAVDTFTLTGAVALRNGMPR